ncbi:hypothetical protein B0J14DRAFT_63916 [Halenospora varia]|nr:hypothetical protein B0J14DRAFT_63916 [Halenospora varia]
MPNTLESTSISTAADLLPDISPKVTTIKSCVPSYQISTTIANFPPLPISIQQSMPGTAGSQLIPELSTSNNLILTTFIIVSSSMDGSFTTTTISSSTTAPPSSLLIAAHSVASSHFQTSQSSNPSLPVSVSTSSSSTASSSPNNLILIITITALVFMGLIELALLFLTRKRRKVRLLVASRPLAEGRGLRRSSTAYPTQFQVDSSETPEENENESGIISGEGQEDGLGGIEGCEGGRCDARGIRWPEKVVLRGEARELWELGLEWERSRAAKREGEGEFVGTVNTNSSRGVRSYIESRLSQQFYLHICLHFIHISNSRQRAVNGRVVEVQG